MLSSVCHVRSMVHEVHYNLELAVPNCQRQGCRAIFVNLLLVCAALRQLLDPLQIARCSTAKEVVNHLDCLQTLIQMN
jgi:hypothetical protein